MKDGVSGTGAAAAAQVYGATVVYACSPGFADKVRRKISLRVYRCMPYASKRFGVISVNNRAMLVTRACAPRQVTYTCGQGGTFTTSDSCAAVTWDVEPFPVCLTACGSDILPLYESLTFYYCAEGWMEGCVGD
jgi:hypothetical protein